MDPTISSSPSNSSISSSDLDTQSTGSFFADRSTTLGTLMGVNVPNAIAAHPHRTGGGAAVDGGRRAAGRRRRRRRWRRGWWRLCRDNMAGPKSLGELLQVERMGGDLVVAEHEAVGGEALFEDGRLRPPAPAPARERGETVGRFSGRLMAGICSGGEG